MKQTLNLSIDTEKLKMFCKDDFLDWQRLGHGAFSEVFSVVHKKTLEKYALKRIKTNSLSKNVIENLRREIEIHS